MSLSPGWWQSFKKRHPTLTLRTAAPLSYARAVCSSPEILSQYYDLLEKTLVDNDLDGKPAQIFNMDETGFPLDPRPPLVIAPVGAKYVSQITTGNKAQVTVISCCNAAGYAMPPTVVFDRKFLRQEYTVGEVPGTTYALSSSGWVNSEIFNSWFHKHFLAYASPQRPILLLLDGHSSHFEPSVVRSAAEEGVLIFCLPPHTTHLTQPLDKGCFGPMKMFWHEECQEFLSKNPGKVVTRYQFSELFGRTWLRGMTLSNIISGFRTTGIYPFHRTALQSKLLASFDPTALSSRTGLKFIPLYSPARPYQSRAATEVHENYCASTHLQHDDSSSTSFLQNTSGCIPEVNLQLTDSSHHHSDDSDREDDVLLRQVDRECTNELRQVTVLSKCLSHHQPMLKMPSKRDVSRGGRLLTSKENLQIMEEKEIKKKEKEEKKEKARLLREEHRQKKEKEAEERKKLRVLRQEKNRGVDKRKKIIAKKPSASTYSTYDPSMHLSSFTADELQLFEHRYNEGYDLYDERYNLWLQANNLSDGRAKCFGKTVEKTSSKVPFIAPDARTRLERTATGVTQATGQCTFTKRCV